MGMKVAAVSVMCQDKRVFDAMMNAGTPCPFEGMIGSQARDAWENNPELQPEGTRANRKGMDNDTKSTLFGSGVVGTLLLLLLL